MSVPVPPAEQQDQTEQLSHSCDQGSHIGHGSSSQYAFGTGEFVPIQITVRSQSSDGAVACIEFHRQCYQLEHHHQRKGQNSDLYQRLCREEQTRNDQRNGQPGAEIGDGNNGIAEGKRGIIRCMLDGMAHLMGGNTDAAMEVEVYTESESRTTLERGS